jgi:hypothetical protein
VQDTAIRLVALHEGTSGNAAQRIQNLRDAAQACRIDFVALDSLACDYAAVRPLGAGDILYNAGRGSARLETLLLGPEVTTFYGSAPLYVADRHDSTLFTAVHDRLGIPGPRTIHALPVSRELLETYVEQLGGFPLVIKAVGGTNGLGTTIVESWRSLASITDYMMAIGTQFILRQYIEASDICRAVVLDGQVIASNSKPLSRNDFRTSGAAKPRRYAADVEDLAIRAAAALDLEFGGADILLDKAGKPYLLEFNFPCNYLATELACGVPIGALMVEHLKSKALRRITEGEAPAAGQFASPAVAG